MSRPKAVYLGLIVSISIMAVSVTLYSYNLPNFVNNSLESTSETNYLDEEHYDALLFLIKYNGMDGKGSGVLETIGSIIKIQIIAFDNENENYDLNLIPKKIDEGIFHVDLHMIGSDVDSTFQFVVDMNQKTVVGRNSLGNDVIQVVEAEGGESEQEIDPKTFCTDETKMFYEGLGMSDIYQEISKEKC